MKKQHSLIATSLGRLVPIGALFFLSQMVFFRWGDHRAVIMEQFMVASTDGGGGDLHHSSTAVLDLLDWELQSLEKPLEESCHPPDNSVSDMCCLGTPTHLPRAPLERDLCGHLTLEDYQWQRGLALQELVSMAPSSPDCDVCRIVNVLRQQGLSFAFLGDSVSSQVTNALVCELQRRHYTVTMTNLPLEPRGDGYRNFRQIRRLVIRSPLWFVHDSVTLDFFFQYRLPFLFEEELHQVTNNYDVLVVNFGLHWVYQPNPDNKWERERYNHDTLPLNLQGFFNAVQQAGKVKLLAYRENTATHFDGDQGDFSLARAKPGFETSQCVPHAKRTRDKGVIKWRERAFEEAIQRTNYTIVRAGQNMPPKVSTHKSEVVVLPFHDFSAKSHAFHKRKDKGQDCLHFCYSPFFYLPIWRGLRLALDRAFPLPEAKAKS